MIFFIVWVCCCFKLKKYSTFLGLDAIQIIDGHLFTCPRHIDISFSLCLWTHSACCCPWSVDQNRVEEEVPSIWLWIWCFFLWLQYRYAITHFMIIIIDSSSKYILLKWRKIPSGSREYEIFGIAVLCFFLCVFRMLLVLRCIRTPRRPWPHTYDEKLWLRTNCSHAIFILRITVAGRPLGYLRAPIDADDGKNRRFALHLNVWQIICGQFQTHRCSNKKINNLS